MLKKIFLGLAIILVLIIAYAQTQPTDFKVERSAIVNAPPQIVFDQVNDFHKWDAWSPWAKLDPNAKNTFEGPSSGVGTSLSWDGNGDVGTGKMTITESLPPKLIRLRLDFMKPMSATDMTLFTFEPTGVDQTRVTWDMTGKKNFVSKIFCMFMSMDKMVGGMFEKGLAQLNVVSESAKGASKKQ